jgi:hypothetical protein
MTDGQTPMYWPPFPKIDPGVRVFITWMIGTEGLLPKPKFGQCHVSLRVLPNAYQVTVANLSGIQYENTLADM